MRSLYARKMQVKSKVVLQKLGGRDVVDNNLEAENFQNFSTGWFGLSLRGLRNFSEGRTEEFWVAGVTENDETGGFVCLNP